MKTILVTGVLGFIFSNFIRKVVEEYPEYRFVGVDKAVRKYNLSNAFSYPGYNFYLGDIADHHFIDNLFEIEKPDIIIAGAAESFVDDSISDIMPFLHSNIVGTQVLVNAALKHGVEKFIQISTDEVFGQKLSLNEPPWTEEDPMLPRNPYACTKASSELIVKTAHYTHGLQYSITRSANVFGPRQKKENLIPHILHSLIKNEPIKIHGNGLNFRQWGFVENKIEAIMTVLKKGEINETYNIGSQTFLSNLEMVQYIAKMLNKEPKIEFIKDRKAHDFGYNVSTKKLRALGWAPQYSFDEGMKLTIEWYINDIRNNSNT